MAGSKKPTLTEQVGELREIVTGLATVVTGLATQGQPATAAPVAEAVTEAEVAPLTPREQMRAEVEAKGLALAKGGALQGSVEVAQAIVRALKVNTPGYTEIVSVQGEVKSLDARHVTHIAVVILAPGHFTTQYVYTPSK